MRLNTSNGTSVQPQETGMTVSKNEDRGGNIVELDSLSIIFNIVVQVLLLAFVFTLLYIFAWKPFIKYLSDRQNAVIEAQESARKETEKASQVAMEAKAKLQEINGKADEIIENAEETAKQIVAKQREVAQKEITKKMEVADLQLEQERRRLEEEMEAKAVTLASDIAAQFLTSKISEEATEQQIEHFLEKMGEE